MEKGQKSKAAIARIAAQYIQDNDTIYIDSGTTCIRLCPFVKSKQYLKIITNSIAAAVELTKYHNCRVFIVGGEIIHERLSVHGAIAQRQMNEYHVHKAFIGTEGVSVKHGLTAYDNNEANISKAMVDNADQVFLLCDSSKIERDAFYKFAALDKIDHLVTDEDVEPEIEHRYRSRGINLLIAHTQTKFH
jgi:DeoR family fructose operon transcriptional repressor